MSVLELYEMLANDENMGSCQMFKVFELQLSGSPSSCPY